jgi:hypothetical protein
MPGYLQRSVDSEVGFSSGEVFDEGRDPRVRAATQTMERLTYYGDALRSAFEDAEKYWRMYMLIRKDNFKPWEYWRSSVTTAHPNTVIEVGTASLVNQVLSHTPPIMPESQSALNASLEDRLTKWWGYTLRSNKFERELELFIREMLVQGFVVRKNVQVERSREIIHFPSDAQAQQFEEELDALVTQFGAQPPMPEQFQDRKDFLKAFEDYRRAANSAFGTRVPEFPSPGPRRIVHYKGPGWKRVSMFNFFYDPAVAIEEQEDMILTATVDEGWVRKRSDPADPNSPFDPEMVELALGRQHNMRSDMWDAQGRNQWESRLARIVSSSSTQDDKPHPGRKKPAFIVEHYFPGSKIPYRVILNGYVCINRRKSNPWEHGDFPFTIGTNVNVPFVSSGIPELRIGESIFKETNSLRALTLDGVKLSVLPILSRIRDSGLTDLAKFIVPGAILDTVRSRGALEQVTKISPPDTLRHLAELRTEIEDAHGTYPQARGAPGPGGITATQTERAFAGMAARSQVKLHRLESDLSTLAPQWLSIAHQFLDQDDISSLSRQLIAEATAQYSLEDFMQGIGMNWAFRASRVVASKEMQIANLKDMFTLAVNAFAAMPVPPIHLDKLFLAIAEKIDPEIARAVSLSADEKAQKEAELTGGDPNEASNEVVLAGAQPISRVQ